MKDFSKWLEAWENYPPVPDWMSTLDLAVVEIFGCAAILGLVIGIFGVSSYESGLGKIACISFAVGIIGILLGFFFSVFVNVYYEGKASAPLTLREQISTVWNLEDIDCDSLPKRKLPTEDLKCVVYKGDKRIKVTLHASESKVGLYTSDGKRFLTE